MLPWMAGAAVGNMARRRTAASPGLTSIAQSLAPSALDRPGFSPHLCLQQ
jgi:hypothetical protein